MSLPALETGRFESASEEAKTAATGRFERWNYSSISRAHKSGLVIGLHLRQVGQWPSVEEEVDHRRVRARAYFLGGTQLVLRSVIGARELDAFLTEKDAVAQEIKENVRRRADELGLELASVGSRDVILPGDRRGRIVLNAVHANQAVSRSTYPASFTRI